ncbi:eukaryotic translation initiation factor 5B-like, partial [Trifolium medium]|nr:eukaryotic translation initiation factor 5B-like [Trifolium medium]
MEGKKDEDFGALSASFFSSFLDVDDENYNAVAEKEDVILLRFPICCVIGHGYIGKTTLLNYIRGAADFQYDTTKRITATFVPSDYIVKKTKELKPDNDDHNFPGLLFLDTPGLTSFTNL